jgi:hypothetical protein
MDSQSNELSRVGDDIVLDIDDDHWRLVISGVRRMDPDWFVQVLALGPHVCTFTVRVGSPPHLATVVASILSALEKRLREPEPRRHVFLDLRDTPAALPSRSRSTQRRLTTATHVSRPRGR